MAPSDVIVGQYPVNLLVPALSSAGLLPSTRSVMGWRFDAIHRKHFINNIHQPADHKNCLHRSQLNSFIIWYPDNSCIFIAALGLINVSEFAISLSVTFNISGFEVEQKPFHCWDLNWNKIGVRSKIWVDRVRYIMRVGNWGTQTGRVLNLMNIVKMKMILDSAYENNIVCSVSSSTLQAQLSKLFRRKWPEERNVEYYWDFLWQ